MRGKFLVFRILFVILALGAGCAGREINEEDPASLFEAAEENIGDDQYALALEKLRTIRHKFPYSNYSPLAQLRIADVYFLEGSYAEAASAYESFRDLHPKHERSAYAMYRIGEAHFESMPGHVARDLTAASNAISAFEAFLKRYPKDEKAAEARSRLNETRSRLAEKELYIANFYLREGDPIAAAQRLEKLISLYPNTEAAGTAKERLPEVKDEAAQAAVKRNEKEGAIRARERN